MISVGIYAQQKMQIKAINPMALVIYIFLSYILNKITSMQFSLTTIIIDKYSDYQWDMFDLFIGLINEITWRKKKMKITL